MERNARNLRGSKPGKQPWSHANSYPGGGAPSSCGLLGGFSWPPRSYTCSFCKREFRSAQALGGHMNVHRRDRARLRQSPPWDAPTSKVRPDLNLSPIPSSCPNPLPNLNVTPPSCDIGGKVSPVAYAFSSLLSPLTCTHFSSSSSLATSDDVFFSRNDNLKAKSAVKAFLGVEDFNGFPINGVRNVSRKKGEIVRLDLEIGVCGDLKEDLDLELRLGYT